MKYDYILHAIVYLLKNPNCLKYIHDKLIVENEMENLGDKSDRD